MEGVLDSFQPDVVHTHEAQDVGGQLLLGIGARLLRLQADPVQLAAFAGGPDLGGLRGIDVAAHKYEFAAALQPRQHLVDVQFQDYRQRPGSGGWITHVGRPGGYRIELSGERQHAPVAIQQRTAFDCRQPHRGPRRRSDHDGGVAPDQEREADAHKQREQKQPAADRLARCCSGLVRPAVGARSG